MEQDTSIPPPVAVRTTISMVLFVHWFAVCVALYGGLSPGRDGDQNLKERLRSVVAPYTQAFNFETTAKFHLTHAVADDAEFRIEYLPDGGTESDATQWVIFSAGRPGTEGQHRYQRLGETLGGLGDSDNDDAAAMIVASLGEHLRSELGRDVAQIRCFRHLLQERQEVNGANAARRNPDDPSYFDEVYRAQLKRLRGGRLFVRRVGQASQEAPVTGGGGTSPQPQDSRSAGDGPEELE